MRTEGIIFLTAYITFWTALALSSVGEVSEPSVFDWWLPIMMFMILSVPAYLGYEIGKANRS